MLTKISSTHLLFKNSLEMNKLRAKTKITQLQELLNDPARELTSAQSTRVTYRLTLLNKALKILEAYSRLTEEQSRTYSTKLEEIYYNYMKEAGF